MLITLIRLCLLALEVGLAKIKVIGEFLIVLFRHDLCLYALFGWLSIALRLLLYSRIYVALSGDLIASFMEPSLL